MTPKEAKIIPVHPLTFFPTKQALVRAMTPGKVWEIREDSKSSSLDKKLFLTTSSLSITGNMAIPPEKVNVPAIK